MPDRDPVSHTEDRAAGAGGGGERGEQAGCARGAGEQRTPAALDDPAAQRALLELAPDPVFIRDALQRITFWNAAAEQVYGFTRQEALGKRAPELLRTQYPVPLEEIERAVKEHGVWEGDLVQTTKAGDHVTVASRWGAVYGDRGEVAAFLEVNRDITERLEAEAEAERHRVALERERMTARLVRAQRLESLGHLAGGIAHDFNNLLAVIGGYASVARRRLDRVADGLAPDARSALEEALAQIGEASDRGAELTRQMLAFARQETVEAEVVDLNAEIAGMLELLRRALGSDIRLRTALDPATPPVRIDPGQLGQILVNLAVNSRAAMPEGGELVIETAPVRYEHDQPVSHGLLEAGSYARVRVTDRGSGMAPEVVEHAFDPFFTTSSLAEATGLGLATVHGIVTRFGGQAEIDSEPGRGTSVSVLLPAAAPAPAEPGRRAGSAPAAEGVAGSDAGAQAGADAGAHAGADAGAHAGSDAGAHAGSDAGAGMQTVLIVEDEPALRRIIAGYVADAGYRVLCAGDAQEAVQLARQPAAAVDLVLTDLVMPGMLGQQLAQELRRDDPSLRVLYMSGFAAPVVAETARSLSDPLLPKPFTEEELVRRIAEALQGGG